MAAGGCGGLHDFDAATDAAAAPLVDGSGGPVYHRVLFRGVGFRRESRRASVPDPVRFIVLFLLRQAAVGTVYLEDDDTGSRRPRAIQVPSWLMRGCICVLILSAAGRCLLAVMRQPRKTTESTMSCRSICDVPWLHHWASDLLWDMVVHIVETTRS